MFSPLSRQTFLPFRKNFSLFQADFSIFSDRLFPPFPAKLFLLLRNFFPLSRQTFPPFLKIFSSFQEDFAPFPGRFFSFPGRFSPLFRHFLPPFQADFSSVFSKIFPLSRQFFGLSSAELTRGHLRPAPIPGSAFPPGKGAQGQSHVRTLLFLISQTHKSKFFPHSKSQWCPSSCNLDFKIFFYINPQLPPLFSSFFLPLSFVLFHPLSTKVLGSRIHPAPQGSVTINISHSFIPNPSLLPPR